MSRLNFYIEDDTQIEAIAKSQEQKDEQAASWVYGEALLNGHDIDRDCIREIVRAKRASEKFKSGVRWLVCQCCGAKSRQWCRDLYTPSGDACHFCQFGYMSPDFNLGVEADQEWREGEVRVLEELPGNNKCECEEIVKRYDDDELQESIDRDRIEQSCQGAIDEERQAYKYVRNEEA